MKKKILAVSMTMMISASVLFGCSSDTKNTETQTSEKENKNTADTSKDDQSDTKTETMPVTVDMESFDEEDYTRVLVTEDSKTSAEDGITVLASTKENTVYLKENEVLSEVSGVSVEESTVTISAPGVYIITGILNDGQIVVDCEEKGTVELVLYNADISNTKNSPVYIKNAKKVLMVLAENSTNTLSDAENYTYEDTQNEEPSACLFSKDDLVISGGGTLTVNANFNNGIASKDTLKITGGDISVTAKNNGIKGKDCLLIAGGSFDIQSEGDGLKSDNSTEEGMGYINILDGVFTIQSGEDGIQAETVLSVSGGTFDITTGAGAQDSSAHAGKDTGWDFDKRFSNTETAGEESTSIKGVKAGTAMNLSGGVFTVDAEDDAFHSNGTFSMTGGTFYIATGDDGIHADDTLTITDGVIDITKSYEGIESPEIIFDGGTAAITASDDGMNAAGGELSGSSAGGGFGGMMSASTGTMVINDGYIYINAAGDGLDSNGDLTVNGGTIIVEGPTDNGNTAVDYESSFNMNGGVLLAAGSSGMVEGVSATSKQNSVTCYFSNTLSAGTSFAILDEEGNAVMSFKNTKSCQCFIFSSPELVSGNTYTVQTNGTCGGTEKNGLYEGGTYSGGTQLDSFTISSVVTSVGNGGMGGPNGNMGGNGGMGGPKDDMGGNGGMGGQKDNMGNGGMGGPKDDMGGNGGFGGGPMRGGNGNSVQ